MGKPNWEQIKAEYITSSISYRKLAEKWGVSFRTLGDRAKREGWVEDRAKHCDIVVSATVQEIARITAVRNVDKLIALQEAADNLVDSINLVLQDTEQFHRHIVDVRSIVKNKVINNVEERVFMKVDTRALRNLVRALKDLVAVMRNVYDLPTMVERYYMNLAKKRLKLDKIKTEKPDIGCGVVIVKFEDDETKKWPNESKPIIAAGISAAMDSNHSVLELIVLMASTSFRLL